MTQWRCVQAVRSCVFRPVSAKGRRRAGSSCRQGSEPQSHSDNKNDERIGAAQLLSDGLLDWVGMGWAWDCSGPGCGLLNFHGQRVQRCPRPFSGCSSSPAWLAGAEVAAVAKLGPEAPRFFLRVSRMALRSGQIFDLWRLGARAGELNVWEARTLQSKLEGAIRIEELLMKALRSLAIWQGSRPQAFPALRWPQT